MGLLRNLFGALVSTTANNYLRPKAENWINGIYDDTIIDKQISKDISAHLLERYGQKTFYNDLDSYITNNGIIENLIHTVRGKSNIEPSNQAEFATTNLHRFIEQHKEYRNKDVQQGQIYDIFTWMFDFAFSKANSINPHTDSGKLQNDLHRVDSASECRQDRNYYAIESLRKEVSALRTVQMASAPTTSCVDEQKLKNCTAEIEAFRLDIKSIESEYQHKYQFKTALTKYYDLLQSIAGKLSGQSKEQIDALICILYCNIALCQANLDDTDKAYRSLESIPKTTAEKSKTYHFVYASVFIQHNDSAKYLSAELHLNRALEIDPQYHRAFLMRQYLYAIMCSVKCGKNIKDLNNYFSQILSENRDQRLISDFYMNRGVIYLTYEEPFLAENDFRKASEYGSNEIITKINLSVALYLQVFMNLPKDKRLFNPKVDFAKVNKIILELDPLVKITNIDTLPYKSIASRAITLYISACTFLGVKHGLSPISKYLDLCRDYETIRELILGSKDEISDKELSLLDDTDRTFVRYSDMMKNEDYSTCMQGLLELNASSPDCMSAPLFHILLQAFLATKNSGSYWKYRESAVSAGVDGGILDAMDACAFELDGKLEKAKALFDSVASTSDDYQLLDNTLRFYKRNMFNSECTTLYLRIQGLHEKNKILIEDLNSFYSRAINFFVSINSPLAEDMIERINPKEVSLINYNLMQAVIYSKTNDVSHLATCLTQIYADRHNFQDGFNLAMCQKSLMDYDSALSTCFELLELTKENKDLMNLYWFFSDLYLLKEDLDESYSWAQKAHELTIQNPYNQSHQALLVRALRCGHEEGFAKILEYKKTHPVVVDWIQEFSIRDDEDPAESLIKQLEKFAPNAGSYKEQEKDIASRYRSQTIPINVLLEFYHNDLWQLFRFAEKNKIRIAMGNLDKLRAEEESIGHHIAVDAQTLIILAYYGCLPALQSIEHIHINYGSLNTLQYYYLSNDYPCIRHLLRWIESADNIIFHPDGFIEEDNKVTKALSRDFVASCMTSRDNKIPLLYSDSIAPACAIIPEQNIFQNIKFVSIPALCNYYGHNHPELRDQMLYRLLTGCTFINFSANTIIEQISSNDFHITDELMHPFLICKSDYDMKSFADVYLQTLYRLQTLCPECTDSLTKIILKDTKRIWCKGIYYRDTANKYSNIESQDRSAAITAYVVQIIIGIKKIKSPSNSSEIGSLCDQLQQFVTGSLTNKLLLLKLLRSFNN